MLSSINILKCQYTVICREQQYHIINGPVSDYTKKIKIKELNGTTAWKILPKHLILK